MKFTASVLTLLAVATGALAAPGGSGGHGPPKPPTPPPPPSNSNSNNNNNNQQNSCGNGQSLYCCASNGKNSDVDCYPFFNGGTGLCTGIQMCCNNNNGNQGCNFNVGGGTITIKKTVKNFGW
ncbi:hypothetical protein QWA68_012391 [Fusarium oxysporum]|nr:hypothetical protein QWA68_012391 [Fusarium oxysporum]